MRRRRYVRRTLLLVAAFCALQLPTEQAAHADMFGGDLPLLMGILTQSVSTVGNLVSMLATLHQQLGALNTMLSKLDPSSYSDVESLLRSNELSYDELTKNVQSMGYTLGSVNSQFRAVYARDFQATKFAQFDALYGKWQDEILASAEIAARSQASLSTLRANTDEAARILSHSSASDGEVAQLQATVQMLGVLASQNNSLIQSLTTTGRVLTSSAATAASQEHLSREKKKRHLEGYRDRGPATPPMTKLP